MSLNRVARPQARPVTASCQCGCYQRPRRYPTDLTDAQWAIVEPLLPVPAHRQRRGGRREKHHRRAVIDAIFYLIDNGVKWRALPADFPPWRTVYGYFSRWSATLASHDLLTALRAQVRTRHGRTPSPTAGCIDSQSVAEAAEGTVPRHSSGFDHYKRVNGRKRHITVDTLGLLISVLVTPASTHDRDAARILLTDTALHGLGHIWADSAYLSNALADWAEDLFGLTLQVVPPLPRTTRGFQPAPHRWVVERTFAWISRRRRCARDYERLTEHHETAVHWAAIIHMTRRLTQPPTD